MNKIFRIVWSQATQSWVAVSELTKAHKKQSSSNSQGSAVKFSGNFIKSSAIALALLSGHSAYAAVNAQGTGSGDSVAWGTSSDASGNNAVAVGKESKATQNNAVAVGRKAQATGDSAIAVGIDSQASGTLAEAIGVGSKAIGNKSVAISTSSKAEGDRAIAIGDNSNTNGADTIALGTNSKATSFNTVALGRSTQASGQRSMAFGNEAKATANDTIAFGSSSEAKKNNDIIIGKEAKSRDEGGGHSVAVGYNATAGSSKTGAATDVTRTGTNEAAGGVAIGVSSYTGLNRNNTAINSSVAIGAGAGAGYRAIGADGLPTGNGTDPDDNATVLVKAFGGTKATLSNFNNSGTAAKDGFFSFQGVDINEGTALGRNTRAIGDQSVAIGAQSIAGMGSIVIGGNDIQAYDGKNYFKAANPTSGPANTVNDYDAPTTPGTGKNGQPITISKKYEELVGAGLDRSYRASYGQDGSTVIGMQAHSTTPLGVAIGTNSIVRKGAFGSTAIGSGASILANAEAAVAIGMGAEAQGNYAVAAGTAARAKESAVAVGYQANAVESSVAVGHEAKSTKESDIAVGKGAIASGNQGAIAMGLGTNAQGDSSIMIGGSNISSAANQRTEFEKATGGITAKSVTEKINGKDVTRNYTFAETTTTPGTIAEAYKELTGLDMDVSTLDFADAKNKNGHASTSLGVHALSKGNLATAIGAGARADAIGSLALGTGAHATKQNAVAIGTGSTTALVGTRQLSVNYDSDGNIVSDNDKDKIAYTFKWAGGTNTSEGDVVSFGSSGAERQLKNVAAGRVAEDSTDAINGSQLNSITKKIAAGFNTSGNVVTGSSGEFTSKQKNANVDSAKKDYETAIRSEDKVQFQVGNNLKLDRDETEVEVEVPDDFNKNQKVKKKIRKADFAYSLNPVLTNLTSAEFKGSDTAPTTKLTNAGVTITPVTAGKSPVSLTENGLNNGGNAITDVAGNLEGAKTGTTEPKNKADKPNNVDDIKNNAATVGDVLNAGWNLQGNTTAKDFVTAYDTVNFVDGDGTTVSVENTDGKTSKIKYSVNTGNGLQKDPTGNTISVKPADKSLEVTNEGVKVKAADNTLTTDDKGLKVNTGEIEPVTTGTNPGTVKVKDNDAGKIATVDSVVKAVNSAAWIATSDKTTAGELGATPTDQSVKAGDKVTFEADKNIKITQAGSKFTFTTKNDVSFNTVQVGGEQGPKLSKTDEGDFKVSGSNGTDPVKVTNVKSGLDTYGGNVPGTTAKNTGLVDLSKPTTGEPKVSDNTAATVGDLRNMGWIVSSDKTTGADGAVTAAEYSDKVKNANEVKFVGKNAAKVSGKTDPTTGIRTITVDVAEPDVKTAELVSSKDGSVIAPSTNPDLQKALKNAKDELAAAATPEQKEAAKNKVKAAETALNNALDNKGVATAKNVADMINNSGFTLKTSKVEGGEKDATSTGDEVINPGKAVEMVAGKNLTVKQEANGKVTYATKDEVEFNTVKVGNPNTYVDNNGEPLVKVGDNYYKPEQLENGKPKNGEMPVDPSTVKNQVAPVNMKTEAATPANNNVGKDGNSTQPTTALNFTSGEGDNAKPTQLKGVGSVLSTKEQPTSTGKQGDTPATAGNQNLVNLGNNPITGKSDLAPEILNSAATVGDLANMGWVVSTKDGNGYKDVVKNANQVDFVGKNGITVTGETKDGIRTITVETAQSPVVYTDKEGNKLVKAGDNFYPADSVVFGDKAYPADSVVIDGNVYPAGTTADDVKAGTATPATALTNGKKPADVIASMNNGDDKSANAPMQLGNVAQGAETIAPVDADGNKLVKANDGKYYPAGKVKADGSLEDGTTEADAKQPLKLANDGKWYPADQISAKGVPAENAKAVTPPATMDPKAGLVDFANSNPNNAATVGDLQNMGWIVGAPANGYTDQVRNANKVNFVGKGIATVTGETDAEGVRTITVNVANGLVDVAKNETDTATGAVTGPKKAAEDALKAAKAKLDELNNNPTATEEEKKAAQDAVNKAQSAVNNAPNLVATAQNVADMINKSGFNLKTSAAEGQKVKGTKDEGELINPGATVEMVAGKNMSVKQDENGKVTYATKDDVSFNTVNVGEPETYKNAAGETVVKGNDGKFYKPNELNADGKPNEGATGLERDKVTVENPQVTLKREAAKEATNNDNANKPSSALNVSSSDGKPTQLKGVGSVLDATAVPTAPEGTKDGKTATPEAEQPKLVNLEGKKDPKTGKVEPLSDETLNSAATVRDIANMGWVVSTKDGNGYKDVVKNANQVDFKGGAGISVKGETTKDGVREITISVKDGEVIKPNQFTAKVNGTDTPVTKVGDQYYNTADIDPKTGKPNAKANPVTPDAGTTPTNAGDGYVTGNKVATAIQKSGFVVGKQTETLSAADFNDKDEKVNPDDELRFADGNNTKVKLATKESVDKDGNKVTTTTVKVDVTGLPVQYTAKVNGKDTPVTKVGDKYFTVDDKGNPTATEVNPTDLTTNMVNPAAAPNVIGAPTALGNVKSNLPSVNDADKNAKDVAGNPIAGKDNKSAPITATEAADLLNPKTADGKANPKFAGNNAATVSDVLNTGWNLQNNGEAKDFVKPYDTVNFVDGKGTKAVVETTPNGTTSNVKFDIDTGSITNNANGSVQGPVTPEMQKALEDATNALNSLPPTAPAAVIDAAKKAVADAANNIANVANKVATAQDVANAINKSGFALTTSANGGEKISGTPEMINPGKKVEMVAGKNMTVKQESNGKVTYATASNVTFDSVQFGDKGPKITNKAGNINVSGPDGKTPTKITGVAPGEISATSKDAINGSQLHAVASNLNNKINKVGKHADAGTASALAAANIPQAYTPGKSLVGIAAGNYQGQNGLAVGMSRISDNGKIIIRLSGTANSQGKTGVAAGVGYQW